MIPNETTHQLFRGQSHHKSPLGFIRNNPPIVAPSDEEAERCESDVQTKNQAVAY